ncbi:malto-oligosyltrehalose trehalohydrolase [Ancylobacter sp. 6x-1]|uniref:Malto-oligosyltrehalose trehalohydrolase n=1 Tax=Ancylobacter crimeensis TaxID=2579147 RepID=A0ABT0D778_9HYPH|nr:malto-oligosyltrehalose trehalohydrolase [Ancylobacter crimeensis]MCK0195805.1 malto-oligosyltrehalose trehalohydrolase [Ancylobacter crimeensis]
MSAPDALAPGAPRFGPLVTGRGTLFRLWAPGADGVELLLDGASPAAMMRDAAGMFMRDVPAAGPGTAYMFRVAGHDVPDPASRGQRVDVEGWSVVPAPVPHDTPARVVRPWHEAVIAEVHVGSATPEGTFRALIDRLDHYRDAGYTVIELLPVADFPGRWNWGYDGVLLFAPDRAYGTPEDLKALVDAAHARGLGMMLDVVYNHFGPAGNYLPLYAPSFFRADIHTPWGPAVDLENEMVRAFFAESATHWLATYGFDGLRFDAVHALATRGVEDFLRELAEACRTVRPDAWLVLENHDNTARWLARAPDIAAGGYTAQWNDDWHHVLHHLATGEKSGYYAPYAIDPVADLARALSEGFVFQGESYPDKAGAPRGELSRHLPPDAFVSFIQNHDHIGNRPLGDRLAGALEKRKLDFLRFVLMLCPEIPLFFQGEEAELATPFPFFCDFQGELADAVRQGRRNEFKDFFAHHAGSVDDLPDPLAESTFLSAKLAPALFETPEARLELDEFRQLAHARARLVWPLAASGFLGAEHRREDDVVSVTWRFDGGALVMMANATDAEASAHGPFGADRAPGPPDAILGTVEPGLPCRLGPFSAAVWSEAR